MLSQLGLSENRVLSFGPGSDPSGPYPDPIELGPGLVLKSWNRFQQRPEPGLENLEPEPDPVTGYPVQSVFFF